ncbi:MerR family transcriptional regulator [Peribacillus sp. SCS-26]|uniref:MerR family transcriptional regulator n=1 Tax=Paraperibacillus marinus TaxID=3115295 RepID=UPI00390641D0
MDQYTSGEAAKSLGISVRTIRYYDSIGLVSPARTEESGRRLYTDHELLQLEKILLLKSLSMPLSDIQKIIGEITIEQILELHKERLDNQISQLQQSLKQTQAIRNILQLEGSLNWDQLLPLVRESSTGKKSREDYYDSTEQAVLTERLPKLEDSSAQKWISILKRAKLYLQAGLLPSSDEAQLLAEDCLLLSRELFQGDRELEEKFWNARKSEETSKEMGYYPISRELLRFMEEAISHNERVRE